MGRSRDRYMGVHGWPDKTAAWLMFAVIDNDAHLREELYSPTAEECERLCTKYGVDYDAILGQFNLTHGRRKDVHTLLLDIQKLPKNVMLDNNSSPWSGMLSGAFVKDHHARYVPKTYARTERPVKALQLLKFDDGTDNAEAIREMLGGGEITRKDHGREEDSAYRRHRSLQVEREHKPGTVGGFYILVRCDDWLVMEEGFRPRIMSDEEFKAEYAE